MLSHIFYLMDAMMLDLAAANLLSPLPLCFALGALATVTRSDLRFPEPLYAGLSIYLMLSIGLRGGVELGEARLSEVALPALAALAIGLCIPLWTYALLRRLGGFSIADAAALAAHYGSVSAVTFVAVLAYMEATGTRTEGFMPALLALMEAPAVMIGVGLAKLLGAGEGDMRGALREVVTGKSVLLLAGGLLIGLLTGAQGYAKVKPFFTDLYNGALCLFLLELGMIAAGRLRDFRAVGAFLGAFAIVMPVLHGALGAALGLAAGLSIGGATTLAALAASASYIAAPAAVRLAIPQANPGLYLTAALAITFPFNLTLGIPLYRAMALTFKNWGIGG